MAASSDVETRWRHAQQLLQSIVDESARQSRPVPGSRHVDPVSSVEENKSSAVCVGTAPLIDRTIPSGLWGRAYILELFSGHGHVSSVGAKVLRCPVVTVDMSREYSTPTICATLPRDNSLVISECARLYPGLSPIIWASPPCQEYSTAKTRGERDLRAADACVEAVQTIAEALNARVVIVENPATGMLVQRDVIKFMPFHSKVNYCKYGTMYPKPTMLWFSRDLLEYGFRPLVCNWDCSASYVRVGVKRHVDWIADYDIGDRISVPKPLIADVFIAVAKVVMADVSTIEPVRGPRLSRKDDIGVVNVIMKVRANDDDTVDVCVSWVGCDHDEWIPADNLDCDITEYSFWDDDVREECICLLGGERSV